MRVSKTARAEAGTWNIAGEFPAVVGLPTPRPFAADSNGATGRDENRKDYCAKTE
jgi:hypothetical protein